MSITSIKRIKLNNLVGSDFTQEITLEFLNKFYNNYKKEFKKHPLKININTDLKIAFLEMTKHLIKNNVCDFFELHDDLNLYEYHEKSEFYAYAKIDLYPIYKLRKDKKIFNVLCFILKRLKDYIPISDYEYMEMWDLDSFEDEVNEFYFANKEMKLINAFEHYVDKLKLTYTDKQIFKIIEDYPIWTDFVINSLVFLENPTHVYSYTVPDNQHLDYQPICCRGYYGFSWGDYNSIYSDGKSSVDYCNGNYFEAIAQEAGEIAPFIGINSNNRNQYSEKVYKLKILYNLLNQKYDHNIY